jgi:hypothetical protein
MQNVEASTILAYAGSIIVFLGGLVLAGIRSTVGSIKKDIEELYKKHGETKSQLDRLNGEHEAICGKKHR